MNLFKKTSFYLKYFLIICISWLCIHSIIISYIGLLNKTKNTYYAIVLGNKVNEDGTISDRLKARLDKSIELYNNKKIQKIIVSGGLGIEGYYEGDKMKEYLVLNNIADSNILVDNKGNNTEASSIQAKILCKDSQEITVISQYHHLIRCKFLFKKNGFNNIQTASPIYFEWRDLYALCREFIAYYLLLIKYI